MPRDFQKEFEMNLPPAPVKAARLDLTIKQGSSQPLTPAQEEFNKRMKALEKARAAHDRKRAELDKHLEICRDELMPLVEMRNLEELQMIFLAADACGAMKLTNRRRMAFEDLLLGKIAGLLEDPVGLSDEDIVKLEALHDALEPPDDSEGTDGPGDEMDDETLEEFESMRAMLEGAARHAGIELDLSGLDPTMDPEEFEQHVAERLAAAAEQAGSGKSNRRKHKPSKATSERERLKQEAEDAKKRDFKSLYKQLAKVLHPDLETDAEMKAHKEAWMKRLTAARANGDLRDMLAIEMEWLGEEAGNLIRATDEKLRVYAMVLKEQIEDLKQQTRVLSQASEYIPLRRFMSPFDDRIQPAILKSRLHEEIRMLKAMAATLRRGGKDARDLVVDSAENHARAFGF